MLVLCDAFYIVCVWCCCYCEMHWVIFILVRNSNTSEMSALNLKTIFVWANEGLIEEKFKTWGILSTEYWCERCNNVMVNFFLHGDSKYWYCTGNYVDSHKKKMKCNFKKSEKSTTIFKGSFVVWANAHFCTRVGELFRNSENTPWNKYCTRISSTLECILYRNCYSFMLLKQRCYLWMLIISF